MESKPKPAVLDALVRGLRGSYQRNAVHEMLAVIADQVVTLWRAGDRSFTTRDLVRDTAHAYKYGTKPDDMDLVLEMCDEPTFTVEGDDEDFRNYWFEALIKIKRPQVAEFARTVVRNDVGRWSDYRVSEAMRIVGRAWEPADPELCFLIAQQHPDSEVRGDAKRILKRHGYQEPATA